MLKNFILTCSIFIFTLSLIVHPVNGLDFEKMSVNQKIGQMICLDFRFWNSEDLKQTEDIGILSKDEDLIQKPVTEINDEIREIIAKYNIGSVILFSQNFKDKSQTKKLIFDLQETAKLSGNPPLFICVDQEGGKVERFAFNRERLEDNLELGRRANAEELAFKKGEFIGKELNELGINCNLAPVVDINSNPKNPIINSRSFGDNSEIVSKCGIAFMKGLHSQKVFGVAKHFPGHGDTQVDSHIGLPRVNKSFLELENFELKPFKAMIDSGIDMVMTAHIELPNVENKTIISKKNGKEIFVPATLSKTILNGLLREKLEFKGVIVTDAMNMKAISDNVGQDEAIKMAINAGANIICMPVILRSKCDIKKLDCVYKAISKAIETGEVSIAQIDDSVRKILTLKEKLTI